MQYLNGAEMERFLLSSALLMMLLYLMALPFVNYYGKLDDFEDGTNETGWEHALAADIQLLSSAGSAVILVFLAVLRWADRRSGLLSRF
jgi:hypothetical protein